MSTERHTGKSWGLRRSDRTREPLLPARGWLPRAVGFALLVPVIVLVQIPDAVIFGNVETILYSERVTALRAGLLIAATALFAVVLRRYRRAGRRGVLIRLTMAVAAVLLINNATYGTLAADDVGLGVAIAVDAAVIVAALLAAGLLPVELLLRAGAVMGPVLLVVGVVSHVQQRSDLSETSIRGHLVSDDGRSGDATAPGDSASARWPEGVGNVYHVILDGFHGTTYPEVKRMSGLESLDDFHYYPSFTSPGPLTYASLSASMRGRVHRPGESWQQFWRDSYDEGLWGRLDRAGVPVDVYSFLSYYCVDVVDECQTTVQLKEGVFDRATADLTFLRLLPASVGRLLDSGSGDGALVGGDETADTDFGFSLTSTLLGADDSVVRRAGQGDLGESAFSLMAFDEMLAAEADRPASGRYVFAHALMPHDPFLYDRDCRFVRDRLGPDSIGYQNHALCALTLLDRLTRRLDELGRLDDALIVVHSDHGFLFSSQALLRSLVRIGPDDRPTEDLLGPPFPGYRPGQDVPDITNDELYAVAPDEWPPEDIAARSSALLLVRYPERMQPAPADKPVQGIDIAPTILDALGMGTSGMDGLPLSEVAERPARDPVYLNHPHKPNYYEPAEVARWVRRGGAWQVDETYETEYAE